MQRAVRAPAYIAIWATLFAKGIPYLEKAIQLGEERAHYTLAVICIRRGEANKAPPEFLVLAESVPGKFSCHEEGVGTGVGEVFRVRRPMDQVFEFILRTEVMSTIRSAG